MLSIARIVLSRLCFRDFLTGALLMNLEPLQYDCLLDSESSRAVITFVGTLANGSRYDLGVCNFFKNCLGFIAEFLQSIPY